MKMDKIRFFLYLISLLFSMSLILTLKMVNQLSFINSFKFDIYFFANAILLSVPLFLFMNYFFIHVSDIYYEKSKIVWNSKKIFIISFVTLFINGMIFLLTYYPGVCMVDSIHIIFDPIGYSSQYPLIYSLLTSNVFNLFFKIFNSMNVSFFFLSLLQLLFMCTVLAYVIMKFHKNFKSNKMTFFTILYFNVFMIFTNLNVAHLRDSIFSAIILLLLCLLTSINNSNGKILLSDVFNIKLIFLLGVLTIVRSNGFFVSMFILVFLFFEYKRYWKQMFKIVICVLFIALIPKMMPDKYQKEPLFQEMIAVPLQQVSTVLKYGDVSEESFNYFNKIMSVDVWNTFHSFKTIDYVKWNLFFNRNYLNKTKHEFMKYWYENMFTNFDLYVKSYLFNSEPLWSINSFNCFQSRFLTLNKKDIVMPLYFPKLDNVQLFPDFIQRKLTTFYEYTILFFNNGTCFLIYVLLFFITLYKKRIRDFLIFVPFFAIWVSLMLTCPYAAAFRYMCSFGYSFPFVLMIVFSKRKLNVY